ncbi:serine/threonine-protein kinase, partial [candidate division CSSED10-310 bacterium]
MIRIKRFTIEKEIGKGGFGTVLLATDTLLKRKVALKVLHFTQTDNFEQEKETFLTEAQIIARLEHQNIVSVHDVIEDGGKLYIAMQFVEGESLADKLTQQKKIDVQTVSSALIDLIDALEYAHKHGVIHRDIKPANILVNVENEFILTDFGLAKIIEKDLSVKTAGIKGTPLYMAPEQVSGEGVDERSDLFSLSCVLYEIMTGEKPFHGRNIMSLGYKILHEDPCHLQSKSKLLAEPWKHFLAKGLAKSKIQRFQTAAEMKQAFINTVQMKSTVQSEQLCRSFTQTGVDIQKIEALSAPRSDQVPDVGPAEIEKLEKYVTDIGLQCDLSPPRFDTIIDLSSAFVADCTQYLQLLEKSIKREPAASSQHLSLYSISYLCQDLERKFSTANITQTDRVDLTGLLAQIQKNILMKAERLIQQEQQEENLEKTHSDQFFEGFVDSELYSESPQAVAWLENLTSKDELTVFETIGALLHKRQETFLEELYAMDRETQATILSVLWEKVDIIILEGRARSRSIFEAAVALTRDATLKMRWKHIYRLFSQSSQKSLHPRIIRDLLKSYPPEQRRIVGRALLIHPWTPYRQMALEILTPKDYWHVISHH